MQSEVIGKVNLLEKVKTVFDSLLIEKEKRQNIEILPFGIKYLDDCLNGIRKDDLVLVGARTGSGKTQLLTNIAMHNANIGKKVMFFALEAADLEIERRIKFQILSKAYYEYFKSIGLNAPYDLNFMDWYDGKLNNNQQIIQAEELIEKNWSEHYKNLIIRYRENSTYTINDLSIDMHAFKDKVDLFIIDHLHYFDFEGENENREYKKIIKQISDLAQKANKPIVIAAHLRKADRSANYIAPNEDDFHGTSDIVKIPTKIITIASAKDIERTPKNILDCEWPTYVRVAKCRTDKSRCMYPALVLFSSKKNSYEENYKLGKLNFNETQWQPLEKQEIPKWAQKEEKWTKL